MASDRGQQAISFLKALDTGLLEERTTLLDELRRLLKNIDHVKDIVGMQQAYARSSGFTMLVAPQELVEDALRMHSTALERHGVTVVREFDNAPPLLIDKHRVLQILVNLISNAKHALEGCKEGTRRVTVGIRHQDGRLAISVADSGVGIAEENLKRIFVHGFTTKPEGHGFGLHSCALAAKEMRGELRVQSDGPGHGATFTLEIPV
jgi:signal transduction histidine kinase